MSDDAKNYPAPVTPTTFAPLVKIDAPTTFAPLVKTETRGAIIAAPFSFTGSAQRLWRLAPLDATPGLRLLTRIALVLVITVAWSFIAGWYMFFGLLVVPYRLIRRGQRKRKVEAKRHAELLAAIQIDGRSQ